MPEPHAEVRVRAAASVVVKALIASTAFAFPVLELDAAEQVQRGALGGGSWVTEHVLRPATPALLVPARCLRQDMREVEGLWPGQVQSRLEGAQELVLKEGMVGAGPLVRGNGNEQGRIAELFLQI